LENVSEVTWKDVVIGVAAGGISIAIDEAPVREEVKDGVRIAIPIVTGIVNKVARVGKEITKTLTVATIPEACKTVYKLVKAYVKRAGEVPEAGVVYTPVEEEEKKKIIEERIY